MLPEIFENLHPQRAFSWISSILKPNQLTAFCQAGNCFSHRCCQFHMILSGALALCYVTVLLYPEHNEKRGKTTRQEKKLERRKEERKQKERKKERKREKRKKERMKEIYKGRYGKS